MFEKLFFAVLVLVMSTPAGAFTTDECIEIAENVYSAQETLNAAPEKFKAIHESVKKSKAEEFGWSEEEYVAIVNIVDNLIKGTDASELGAAIYKNCPKDGL
jgi:N-acetyl-gamma-glutamylphosphate reductase